MVEFSLLALSYFRKTAQLLHFTKAADALHITQPALSRTISTLEQQLNVKLFERKGRNVVLTQYGEIVLRYINSIMLDLENMQQEIGDIQNGEVQTVTLSIFAASKLIPDILMDFKKKYPSIRLNIIQQGIGEGTANTEADLKITSEISTIESDNCIKLLEEDILIAVPISHPLASRKSINLSELAKADFISLQPGKNLRTIFDFYCSIAGFSPHIILESDSPGTVREFISAGIGVAFVPSITWGGMSGDNIVLLPIDFPICRRCVSLSWKKCAYLSRSAVLLRDFMIQRFKQIQVLN